MKEKEKVIVGGLVALLLILWLGFVVHRSPDFAGSFAGGVLAVAGSLLMLVPLIYLIIKRIPPLKRAVTKHISMPTLLAVHIYAGVLGPILVVLHTGHKFNSPLGIALTAITLMLVVSGFVGRYLMRSERMEIKEKQKLLTELTADFEQAQEEIRCSPTAAQELTTLQSFFGRLAMRLLTTRDGSRQTPLPAAARALSLSESIADVEYAIRTHETFKRAFGIWLKFHIVMSFVLYILLALHIWAGIHFGLRWFEPSGGAHFATTSQTVDPGGSSYSHLTSELPIASAADEFSQHYGRLFLRNWRPAVTIHGFLTTVFDYAAIAGEVGQPNSDFTKAAASLQRVDVALLDGGDYEKAFWINIYNFGAMKLAAEHYPVPSIIDPKISADDPWGVEALRIGDESYSLKKIENAILLEKFDDPRIVFAISCAAVSCPDRTDRIFSEASLDQQLDALVRGLFANSTKGLAINRELGVATLSWILKADQRLFGGSDQGVLQFVSRYVPADTQNWLESHLSEIKVEYFTHDWGLNDIALADTQTEEGTR